MLKINVKFDAEKNEYVTTCERVFFATMPFWFDGRGSIVTDVYAYADDCLHKVLYDTYKDENGDEVYSDMSDEAIEKRTAFNNAETFEDDASTASVIARVICAGFGWYKYHNVPKEFATVYDEAVKYAHDFKAETGAWSDEHKEKHTALKAVISDAIISMFARSGYDVSKFSMNGFTDKLYYQQATTDKKLGRVIRWKTLDIYSAFREFGVMFNAQSGIEKPEKEATKINFV